jgi:hypothetical protein
MVGGVDLNISIEKDGIEEQPPRLATTPATAIAIRRRMINPSL